MKRFFRIMKYNNTVRHESDQSVSLLRHWWRPAGLHHCWVGCLPCFNWKEVWETSAQWASGQAGFCHSWVAFLLLSGPDSNYSTHLTCMFLCLSLSCSVIWCQSGVYLASNVVSGFSFQIWEFCLFVWPLTSVLYIGLWLTNLFWTSWARVLHSDLWV